MVLGNALSLSLPDDDGVHEVSAATASQFDYHVNCDGHMASGVGRGIPRSGPLEFLVFGDSRSRPGVHRKVIRSLAGESMHFILGTGDYVEHGRVHRQWRKFFEIEKELLSRAVFFPSVGNHDRKGRHAKEFERYFALPKDSSGSERYYSYLAGKTLLVVLDSNMRDPEMGRQTIWLQETLEAAKRTSVEHVFVTVHHPLYSISLHGGHRGTRNRWEALFRRYQVDAVFSGHDHAYMRGEKGGVRYFVSGGGGAPLYPRRKSAKKIDRDVIEVFHRKNHFLRVSVDGPSVHVKAVGLKGEVLDSLSWSSPPLSGRLVGAPAAQATPSIASKSSNRLPLFACLFGVVLLAVQVVRKAS